MPSLSQTQRELPATYTRVSPPVLPLSPGASGPSLEPTYPINMRCPVPPTNFTPDTSKQFYRGATVPQFRTFAPSPLSGNNNSQGSTTTNNITESSTTTNTVALSAKTAAVSSPVLNPGQSFFATATMSRTFSLIMVSANAAARVRLYATKAAQMSDVLRTDATALNFETTQGVIADVSLDTSPYTWLMSAVPSGANGDYPRTASIYVTLTNIAASSNPITASLLYLPLEP